MIIDHLNLHSIRNKFFDFEELAFNEIDICLISETKIDDSFQTHNFLLTDIFFRRGRNRNGGGLILYVKENILIGDFNMTVTIENSKMNDLVNTFSLENLIKEPTCYISNIRTCIDLILTNQKRLFLKSSTFESGLSDFRKLTTTILRKTTLKSNSKTIIYRKYKSLNQNNFENDF